MKMAKYVLLIIGVSISSIVNAQKPTLIKLENVIVSFNDDIVASISNVDIVIPNFNRKIEVILFQNDSIRISEIIKYRKRKSGMKILRKRHQFYFKGKRLKGSNRWKSDMPLIAKLTGIGFRWGVCTTNSKLGTSISEGESYSLLPRNKGEIVFFCTETMIH